MLGLCDKVVVDDVHCWCDGMYSLITSRECKIMYTSMFSFVIMCFLGSPSLFMSTLMFSSTEGINVVVVRCILVAANPAHVCELSNLHNDLITVSPDTSTVELYAVSVPA